MKPANKRILNILATLMLLASPPAWGEEQTLLADASQALKLGNHQAVQSLSPDERSILRATLALRSQKPDEALAVLTHAPNRDPLAALLEAEAHRMQAIQSMRQAGTLNDAEGAEEQLLASADLSRGLGEADARLNLFIDKLNKVAGEPLDVLQAGPGVANVFMFDKARNRMYLYEPDAKGELHKVADEYVVTGSVKGDKQHQGDGKSPNGVYRFVRKLQAKELEARYGPVAFPIDYPNTLDQLHRKDGNGIWMHGYPADVLRRPPQDTRGCFSLDNRHLVELEQHVKLGRSWVIVGENLAFDRSEDKAALITSVQRDIEAWRRDWNSLDTDAYLKHYHPEFRSGGRDLKGWRDYKHRVNAGKSFIDVELSNMTLIHDPNRWPEGEVVVAQFDQSYRSDNYADHGRKRLYLARADRGDHWKILIEEGLK